MQNLVIGIEGMVSAGKTSICKELLKIIPNSIFIDGGNIYRGIVEAMIKSNFSLKENTALDPLEIMKQLDVEFKIENSITEIYISGNKIENDEIQNAQNSVGVSQMASVANNLALFKFAHDIINKYSQKYNVIVSARDLVDIYPEMSVHVFVTASLEERAKRRYNQYNGKYTMDEVYSMIEKRDMLHQESGFNKTFEKTIKVDVTDCKSAKESAIIVMNNINNFLERN